MCALENVWGALFLFVASMNFWDIVFPPDPIRMDMAIRVVILLFAFYVFRHFDDMQARMMQPQQVQNP